MIKRKELTIIKKHKKLLRQQRYLQTMITMRNISIMTIPQKIENKDKRKKVMIKKRTTLKNRTIYKKYHIKMKKD